MELNENMDKAYDKDKEAYKKVQQLEKLKENLNIQLKTKTREKEDAQTRKDRAHEDKNDAEEKIADKDIQKAEKVISIIKENIQKIEIIVAKNKERVDSYINELKKDPEFKAHINSILEKRYNREIKKLATKKEKVENIIKLCEKHPSLENDFKAMVNVADELRRIKEKRGQLIEELKTLDPVNDKVRIDQINKIELPQLAVKELGANTRAKPHKEKFKKLCEKENIIIDEMFLDKLLEEKRFARTKLGDIKVFQSLGNISKGYEKEIRAHERAIEKIPGARVQKNSTEHDEYLPAKQYKWYQFGKRFKAWRARRKAAKETSNNQEQQENSNDTNKFKDAYKYHIVRDYVDKVQDDILHESGKEVRPEFKQHEQDEQDENQR